MAATPSRQDSDAMRTHRQRRAQRRLRLLQLRQRQQVVVAAGLHQVRPLVEQDRGQPVEVLAQARGRRRQIGPVAAEIACGFGDAVDADDLESGAAALERVEDDLADQAAGPTTILGTSSNYLNERIDLNSTCPRTSLESLTMARWNSGLP